MEAHLLLVFGSHVIEKGHRTEVSPSLSPGLPNNLTVHFLHLLSD